MIKPFVNWTKKGPKILMFGFWMFGIHMVTVITCLQLFRDLHTFYVQHFLLAPKFVLVVHNGFSSHQFSQVYVVRVITPKAKRTFVNDVIQLGGGGLHDALMLGVKVGQIYVTSFMNGPLVLHCQSSPIKLCQTLTKFIQC